MPDLSNYAQQTQNRLVAGLVFLVFTLGLGLIYLLYGQGAAFLGFSCLVGLLVVILLIWLMLKLIERLSK